MGVLMKLLILLLLSISISTNAKESIGQVTVTSIKKESKLSFLVLFKEKAAVYKSSSKNIKCLNTSIHEKRPVLIKWNINTLEISDCKSKRKSP